MRTSLRLGLALVLFAGSVSGIFAADATPSGGTPAAETNPGAAGVYAQLPKDRFGAVVYTITKKDMMLDNWIVELNSSANTIPNRRNSYAKNVRQFNNVQKAFLGVRVHFPTHSYNAFARVAPQYQLPAFDARGYPINYGFFDPQSIAATANPFNGGSATEPAAGGEPTYSNSYSTYSAVSRVPGIKTLIDFNDYETIISNVAGYINVRYLGTDSGMGIGDGFAEKAATVGYDTGMPVIGYPLDPDGGVDAKRMMELTKTGFIFAEADPTRDKDAYAAAIMKAAGTTPPTKTNPPSYEPKTPTYDQVSQALDKIENLVGADAIARNISYNGVIHNVGQLKEIIVRVAGRNYRHGLAIRMRNQNEEVNEYFLGYLDFVGWQYRRWVNPSYLPADEAEAFRLPLYPQEIPYIAFDSFVIYRNGDQIGGDFVTYFDWVKVDYDLAVPPAQLEVNNPDFIDVDDEGWWKVLRERNSAKTRMLMQKFSADIDARRQALGRSVRMAEGTAPVENNNFAARNAYEGGAAAPAGGAN